MSESTGIRVVKVGGRAQSEASLPAAIAAAWTAAPGTLCLVHGGGDEVSALQRALGAEPSFIAGRRVTTARDVDIVRMGLSGTINKRLVARLVSLGVPAVGISGEDGALIEAEPLDYEQYGRVGIPVRVNARLLHHLLAGDLLPVISPLSRDARTADGLNVNGDDAAAAVAIALAASEFLLLSDVPGVCAGGSVLAALDAELALDLVKAGSASGGMAAKLQAGIMALRGGVERVRIGDATTLSDSVGGTELTLARTLV